MALNVHHQLALLHDILNEQSAYYNGTVSEYQQISRLIQSMMTDPSVTNDDLKSILPAISNYCRQGENSHNSKEHISAHREHLNEWMDTIESTMHQMK